MRKLGRSLVLLLAGAVATGSMATAEEWRQWRGPFFNGSTDEKDLPSNFGRTENVVWSAKLPGCSAATPIVAEGEVFISTIDAAEQNLLAMCFDRGSGKLLWQHKIAEGTHRDIRSTYAAASPVTDGKIVVFFYATGDMACFDMAGKPKWKRNIQKEYGVFAFLWTFASSPTLYDGRLYLQVLQRDTAVDGRGFANKKNESYILAIDPATGKTLWQHIRPSKAVMESREAFSTPIPNEHEGTKQLLVVGGDCLTAHDPATGKELWRWGTWNPSRIGHWRLVPTPVAGKGIILACAPKRSPIYAIRNGGKGTLNDEVVAWVSRDAREVTSDVPTPGFYDGDFFVLSDLRKALTRVDPKTGKVKWKLNTPGRTKYEASPLVADGKVYIVNFAGEVTIVDAADGKIIKTIPMDEPDDGERCRASIVAAGGKLFIRTTRTLYCVGK